MTSAVALIKEILDSCSEAERKVANLILAEPRVAVFCSATEVAQRAGTNPPAVVRLCKRAGLSGYRELQVLCTRDLYALEPSLAEPTSEPQTENDVSYIVQSVFRRSKDALDRTLALQKADSLEKAARAIVAARNMLMVGTGSSGLVAYDLSEKLTMIGLSCLHHYDSHLMIAAACALRPDDVAFCISYSGETDTTIRAAREAKRTGAYLITLTTMNGNPLSRLADLSLVVPDTGSPIRLGTSISRGTQLAVSDALYGIIVSLTYDRSISMLEASFKAIH
jgi:DNA-binding MurR/RpiR family transcriptional regulator